MVPSDVYITFGFKVYVNQTVTGYLTDHMVQEPVARVHIVDAGAVQPHC